jgi:hypothetical protein
MYYLVEDFEGVWITQTPQHNDKILCCAETQNEIEHMLSRELSLRGE